MKASPSAGFPTARESSACSPCIRPALRRWKWKKKAAPAGPSSITCAHAKGRKRLPSENNLRSSRAQSRDPDKVNFNLPPRDPSTVARDDELLAENKSADNLPSHVPALRFSLRKKTSRPRCRLYRRK